MIHSASCLIIVLFSTSVLNYEALFIYTLTILHGMYNSKRLTAFFGLEIREMESGSSVWSKPRITKFGNPRVRNMLYMAVLVAIRHNTKMSDFYLRLVNKGKPKKLALIAVARKLLVVACAILNSKKPYEENHISYYNKDLVQIA